MKSPIRLLLCLLLGLSCVIACQQEAQDDPDTPEEETASITGAWDLVSGTYGMDSDSPFTRNPGQSFQLKVFTDKHYALIMQDDTGAWRWVVAGDYKLDGDQYIETLGYFEDDSAIGTSLSWTYSLRGDTLRMSGPTKADGSMALNSMEEIRVRAKKAPQNDGRPNAITGAWHLTHGVYTNAEGESNTRNPEAPFQLKIFTPTHFLYIMQNEEGVWKSGSGGPYYLEGDSYVETHTYRSDGFAGATATWDYQVKGDSLIKSGPTKAVSKSGEDLTDQANQMKEIRVRVP